jgi:5-hydroxyisourate hydrolase-like protein (transthyretin family)
MNGRLNLRAPLGRVLLFSLVVALLAAWSAPALAQETGAIEGVVANGVTGQPVAGVTVTLDRFEGMTATETLTTQTDSAGKYRFDRLPLGEKRIYIARVTYGDVEYPSDMITFKSGETSKNAPIEVFDVSEDGSGISIDRAHVIVQPAAAGVEVSEMIAVSNSGQGAYVGKASGSGPATTLRFYLPAGAGEPAFEAGALGERFVSTTDGFADTQPVRPGVGVDQIIFSYLLPGQKSAWTMQYRLAYPTKALNILVADGWVVSGSDVTYVGKMGSSAAAYLNYAVTNVTADRPISLTFAPGAAPAGGVDMTTAATNTEATSSGPSSQPTLLWITLGALILALAIAVTYPFWGGAATGGNRA